MSKNWNSKKLGEICSKVTDGSHNPPKGIDLSEFMMLSSKNVFDDLITLKKPRFLKREDFESENKRTDVSEGDVLLTIVGTIGRVAVVPKDFPKITLQRSVAVLKPDRDIVSSRYLMYAMQSILDVLTDGARGVAQKGIYLKSLRELDIPLPSIPEQKLIVAILDEAFAGIDQAIANTEKNLASARELFESYLNTIFTQKGEGWEEKTLGEIGKVSMCKRILKKQTTPSGDIPFYKIGTFGKEPNAFITKDIYNDFREKYSFPKVGDVLISASGTIGRRVIYDGRPAYFQDSNIVWIDNDEKLILNEYLYHFYGVCDWNPSKGATISRLYNDDLRKIKISFPDIAEQKKLIEAMYEMNKKTQNLVVIYQQKLIALNELKQSLLQKAFSGELTADIADEIAEAAE